MFLNRMITMIKTIAVYLAGNAVQQRRANLSFNLLVLNKKGILWVLRDEAMAEQRKANRSRTVFRGSIIFNNQNSSIDCMVRNFAETGAKLIVGDVIAIPQQFQLHIPQKGRNYTAHVIWRRGDETGVEFKNEIVNKSVIPAGSGDLGDQMRALEQENAKLKRLVADLQMQISRNQEAG